MSVRHIASDISSGLSSGNRATKSRVGFRSTSTLDRAIPHDCGLPPLARQSAGMNGWPSLTSQGVSRIARTGMLLSANVCQIPT
ncbi:Uncharacterised protein [Mycobacterium tuberculosis]|nr:Uncharacterised protein [Mycobacterium tuberculosis]